MPVHAPPTGPNSFIFVTEKCPHWSPKPSQNGSTPPYGKSWIWPCIICIVSQCDRLITCQLLSVCKVMPALETEQVSWGFTRSGSGTGIWGSPRVLLDELVAPVAGPASANQRPSRHWVHDILTSKGFVTSHSL